MPGGAVAVGIVCGLTAEARIARRISPLVMAGGGHPATTRANAEGLVSAGATALISFGIAGALDPELRTGDLFLAHSVWSGQGPIEADSAWRARLAAALQASFPTYRSGMVLGATAIVATATGKADAFARTGAAAVDLESHIVAEVARSAGLRFVVVRAIADPASMALPAAALVGLKPDGTPALGPVLASLARHPGQLPDLLRVARQTRLALATLTRILPEAAVTLP